MQHAAARLFVRRKGIFYFPCCICYFTYNFWRPLFPIIKTPCQTLTIGHIIQIDLHNWNNRSFSALPHPNYSHEFLLIVESFAIH